MLSTPDGPMGAMILQLGTVTMEKPFQGAKTVANKFLLKEMTQNAIQGTN